MSEESKQNNFGKIFKIGKYEIFLGIPTIICLILITSASIYSCIINNKPDWSAIGYIASLGFVVFHEIGHLIAANYFGDPGNKIQILPIGGIAYLRKQHEGWPHFFVAIAGPLVNAVFFVLLFPIYFIFGDNLIGNMFFYLGLINLVLFLFNILLPIYPMDGGRIVRSFMEIMNCDNVKIFKFNILLSSIAALLIGVFTVFYMNDFLTLFVIGFIFILGIFENIYGLKLEKATINEIISTKWMFDQVRKDFSNKKTIDYKHILIELTSSILESSKYKNYEHHIINALVCQNAGFVYSKVINIDPVDRKDVVQKCIENFAWPT